MMTEPNPPSQAPSMLQDMKSAFNLFSMLCEVVAFPAMILSVRFGTWGPRFLASPVHVLGFFWPWIFASFMGPHRQLGSLVLFWYASMVILLVHGVVGLRRRRRGYRPVSRYWGDCWGQKSGTLGDQRWARQKMVFLIMIGGAIGLTTFAQPLGAMFLVSALAKLISDTLAFDEAELRLRRMEDARTENNFYLDEYRRRNDFE